MASHSIVRPVTDRSTPMKPSRAAWTAFGLGALKGFLTFAGFSCLMIGSLWLYAGGAEGIAILLAFTPLIIVIAAALLVVWLLSLLVGFWMTRDRRERFGLIGFYALFPFAWIANALLIQHNKSMAYPRKSLEHPSGVIRYVVMASSLRPADSEEVMILYSGYASELIGAELHRGSWSSRYRARLENWAKCRDDVSGIAVAQKVGLFEHCFDLKEATVNSQADAGAVFLIRDYRYGVELAEFAAFVADAQGRPGQEFLRWGETSPTLRGYTRYEMLAAITGKPQQTFPRDEGLPARIARVRGALDRGALIFPELGFEFLFNIRSGEIGIPPERLFDADVEMISAISNEICLSDVRKIAIDHNRFSAHTQPAMSDVECRGIYERVSARWMRNEAMRDRRP